jgi:hypothetical protein
MAPGVWTSYPFGTKPDDLDDPCHNKASLSQVNDFDRAKIIVKNNENILPGKCKQNKWLMATRVRKRSSVTAEDYFIDNKTRENNLRSECKKDPATSPMSF